MSWSRSRSRSPAHRGPSRGAKLGRRSSSPHRHARSPPTRTHNRTHRDVRRMRASPSYSVSRSRSRSRSRGRRRGHSSRSVILTQHFCALLIQQVRYFAVWQSLRVEHTGLHAYLAALVHHPIACLQWCMDFGCASLVCNYLPGRTDDTCPVSCLYMPLLFR